MPSPSRFSPSTPTISAAPGASMVHGAELRYARASPSTEALAQLNNIEHSQFAVHGYHTPGGFLSQINGEHCAVPRFQLEGLCNVF